MTHSLALQQQETKTIFSSSVNQDDDDDDCNFFQGKRITISFCCSIWARRLLQILLPIWYVFPSSQNAHSRLLHSIRTADTVCMNIQNSVTDMLLFCLPLCSPNVELHLAPTGLGQIDDRRECHIVTFREDQMQCSDFASFRLATVNCTSKKNRSF